MHINKTTGNYVWFGFKLCACVNLQILWTLWQWCVHIVDVMSFVDANVVVYDAAATFFFRRLKEWVAHWIRVSYLNASLNRTEILPTVTLYINIFCIFTSFIRSFVVSMCWVLFFQLLVPAFLPPFRNVNKIIGKKRKSKRKRTR